MPSLPPTRQFRIPGTVGIFPDYDKDIGGRLINEKVAYSTNIRRFHEPFSSIVDGRTTNLHGTRNRNSISKQLYACRRIDTRTKRKRFDFA